MDHGTNGATTAQVVPHVSRNSALIDITTFPTVLEVAHKAGVTQQAVRKWQKAGKLTAIEDAEGTTRFDPEEVEHFLAARSALHELGDTTDGPPRPDATANMYIARQNRLDEFMFRLLDRLDRRNEFLEKHALTYSKESLENQDAAAERKAVAEALIEETKMKAGLVKTIGEAGHKIIDRLDKQKQRDSAEALFDDLPIDSLKVLLLLDDVFSAEYQKKLLAILQKKQAAEAAKGSSSASSPPSDSSSSSSSSTTSPSTTSPSSQSSSTTEGSPKPG